MDATKSISFEARLDIIFLEVRELKRKSDEKGEVNTLIEELNEEPADDVSIKMIDMLLEIGVAYYSLDKYKEARTYLEKANTLCKNIICSRDYSRINEMDPSYAIVISVLVPTYEALRKKDEASGGKDEALRKKYSAFNYVKDALSLHDKDAQFQTSKMVSFYKLGIIRKARGEIDEALKHFLSALNMSQKLNLNVKAAVILNNISQIYHEKSQLAEAKQCSLEALEILKPHGIEETYPIKFVTLTKLGDIAISLQEENEAREFYNQAKAILTENPHIEEEIKVKNLESKLDHTIEIITADEENSDKTSLEESAGENSSQENLSYIDTIGLESGLAHPNDTL